MAGKPTESHLPDVDEFVHELARLKLLALLAVLKQADFVYLLRHSGMSRGNLSVQMSKMSDAGLVSIEKSFVANRPRTVYALTRQGRRSLGAYKAAMAVLLDALPGPGERS